MIEKKRDIPYLTHEEKHVLGLLRRNEEEHRAQVDEISKKENPTMDDFWVIQKLIKLREHSSGLMTETH